MSFINSLPTEQEIQTIYDDIDDIIVECSHLKPIVKYTPIQNQMSIVSIKSYKEAKIETMEPLKGDTSDVLKELENDFKLKKTSIDVKKELEDVLNFGGVKILNLPRIYHGIIRRDILENIF